MPEPTLKPLRSADFDYGKAAHLLARAGFGGTPAEVRALADMGIDDAVEHLLEADDGATPGPFDPDILRPATDAERRAETEARARGDEEAIARFRMERERRERADRDQLAAMRRWWLARMIGTSSPLREKLVLFWHGHFATGHRTIRDSWHLYRQNELFRAHAMGDFRRLVHAVIEDPAMLAYLDNDENRARSPNENLARELMELFTLGEGNAYTESDIKEGARALTGYTYRDDDFVFDASQHDAGPKTILGRRGAFDGHDFVELILRQPVASEFICWKLYRFLVNDVPGAPDAAVQGVVKQMARRLRESNWNLKPVLRALFRSAHFHDDVNVAAQVKSPIQLLVQSIRAYGTPTRDLDSLLAAADRMGQNLFDPPSVKGWVGGRAWINTASLFVRQNVVVYLLTGAPAEGSGWRRDDTTYDPAPLVAHLRTPDGTIDPDAAVDAILRFALGRTPAPERVRTIRAFLASCGDQVEHPAVLKGMLALIAAMPEHQLC